MALKISVAISFCANVEILTRVLTNVQLDEMQKKFTRAQRKKKWMLYSAGAIYF